MALRLSDSAAQVTQSRSLVLRSCSRRRSRSRRRRRPLSRPALQSGKGDASGQDEVNRHPARLEDESHPQVKEFRLQRLSTQTIHCVSTNVLEPDSCGDCRQKLIERGVVDLKRPISTNRRCKTAQHQRHYAP